MMTKNKKSVYFWITVGLSAAFFIFVLAWTVGRIYAFCTPTYDFGIFAQMFHHMRETGLPLTTVERDGLLTHFAVHVSPIYYLGLPFYWLFPSPVTLQVVQAVAITSAVIPLWKIGKHHKLPDWQNMIVCALLLLYPAYSSGAGYDLHENSFLTPLILWIFYGIDKKKPAVTAIAAILTLMVKEDAAAYVGIIALWLIIKTLLRWKKSDKKDLIVGVALFAAAIAWFFAVTTYLDSSGQGVMTNRYKNFMYDGSASLITVVKSVIINPFKAVYECMDKEKLRYIMLTLFPLFGLPLITRKHERYILIIPYLLVNLMSDYPYQHVINCQYSFGSVAFLVYLTSVNAADLKLGWKRTCALVAATSVSLFFFCSIVVPKGISYPASAIVYHDYYQNIRDTLDTVPDDASVSATTFYTTHLSKRDVLYDVRYCSREHLLETEYVVLAVNSNSACSLYASKGENNGYANLVSLLEESGYEKYAELEDVVVIYHKQQK